MVVEGRQIEGQDSMAKIVGLKLLTGLRYFVPGVVEEVGVYSV